MFLYGSYVYVYIIAKKRPTNDTLWISICIRLEKGVALLS